MKKLIFGLLTLAIISPSATYASEENSRALSKKERREIREERQRERRKKRPGRHRRHHHEHPKIKRRYRLKQGELPSIKLPNMGAETSVTHFHKKLITNMEEEPQPQLSTQEETFHVGKFSYEPGSCVSKNECNDKLIEECEKNYHIDSSKPKNTRAECPTINETSALLARLNGEDTIPSHEILDGINLELAKLAARFGVSQQ